MWVKKNGSTGFDEERKRQVSFKEIIEKPVENITSQNDLEILEKQDLLVTEKPDLLTVQKSGTKVQKNKFMEKRKSIEINEFPKSKEALKLVEDVIEELEDQENSPD